MQVWLVSYESEQQFDLDDEGDAAEAQQEFASFDIELDPEVDEPPFTVQIGDKAVNKLRIDGTTVHRTISCNITLTVTDLEGFNELMEDEDWYDPADGEYEIVSAMNYWICDTCCAPDYAEFVKESCSFDSTQVSSAS